MAARRDDCASTVGSVSTVEALSRTLALCRDSIIVGDNRPTADQLINAFSQTQVLLVADEANLSAASGQHALVSMFNLIARLGVSVRLAIPDLPVLGYQAPLYGESLRTGLLDLGRDLIPGCAAALGHRDNPADIAIVLGDSPWYGKAELAVRVIADDWSAASFPADHHLSRFTAAFPIGGLVAAGVVAPEVFKFAMRRLGRELAAPIGDIFLAPVGHATIRVAPLGTPAGPSVLGKIDVVSGGAIAQAALFTLLHLSEVTATVRVIEPEFIDLSNLNRYPLTRRSDQGVSKVTLLKRWSRPGFDIEGLPIRYGNETRDQVLPFAARVLVGTDDIPSRWAVQREWPSWLGLGATSHFLTVTSSHTPGQPCAGCMHPRDDADVQMIPTVSFVSYWAGLLLAVRLLRDALGVALGDAEQHISCAPLRLDQPRAYWPGPIARRADCPVHCVEFGAGTC